MSASAKIYVVDDDPAVQRIVTIGLSQAGFEVVCFADGGALLAAARNSIPACILLDAMMPGRSGFDILRDLDGETYPAPIFMMSGQGNIAMAVAAIKHGAFDFIEKPFRGSELVNRMKRALDRCTNPRAEDAATKPTAPDHPAHEALTARERQVLELFSSGASNKEAGRSLGVSFRTIEYHRANVMRKLGARNAADMLRIAMSTRGDTTELRKRHA
jgi:FixJ family two-component response regulator